MIPKSLGWAYYLQFYLIPYGTLLLILNLRPNLESRPILLLLFLLWMIPAGIFMLLLVKGVGKTCDIQEKAEQEKIELASAMQEVLAADLPRAIVFEHIETWEKKLKESDHSTESTL